MPKPIKKPVWNNIDAIGMLNGISTWDENYLNLKYVRLPNESNIELRHRINNFNDNPVEGTIDQQLITGLANELNLTSYNTLNVNTFNLTRTPHPIGNSGVQDIFVYYQIPNSETWNELTTQYWGTDIENTTPTSGFIVWEDAYYATNNLSSKSNNYSKLLQIYSDLPDNSRLKIQYTIIQYDEDDNEVQHKFTDMSNKFDSTDTRFVIRRQYDPTISDLTSKPVAYSLAHIPDNFKSKYYNSDGKAGDLMYEIQDKIDDVYSCRWDNIKDRNTIWDINTNFASGTIQSYYDTQFDVDLDGYNTLKESLTGGLNYYNTALYLRDIVVVSSGENENWYPVLTPGPCYINGTNHYLMENPNSVVLDLSSGSGTLPSGCKIQYHTILDMSTTTPVSGYIYSDYDYKIAYNGGYHNSTPLIARKRPYLNSNMGLDISLNLTEYNIDYDNNIIYANGISTCVLYWDAVDVPSGVIINTAFTDLNPLNDTALGFDSYFLTLEN